MIHQLSASGSSVKSVRGPKEIWKTNRQKFKNKIFCLLIPHVLLYQIVKWHYQIIVQKYYTKGSFIYFVFFNIVRLIFTDWTTFSYNVLGNWDQIFFRLGVFIADFRSWTIFVSLWHLRDPTRSRVGFNQWLRFCIYKFLEYLQHVYSEFLLVAELMWLGDINLYSGLK